MAEEKRDEIYNLLNLYNDDNLIKSDANPDKNTLKDRLINYEMEFEYAYNLINNVV